MVHDILKEEEALSYIGWHERARKRHERPKTNTKNNDPLSRVAITDIAEQRRQNHVTAYEQCLE